MDNEEYIKLLRRQAVINKEKGTVSDTDVVSDAMSILSEFVRNPSAALWLQMERQMHIIQARIKGE